MIYRRGMGAALLALLALATGAGLGQDKSVNPGINDTFKDPDLKKYLGTFEVESREIFAQRKEIVAACKLKPGMHVADVGAGTGLFTRLFAQEVGEKGKVYAVDIARTFVEHVEKTAKEEKLTNVVGVVCTPRSAELPPGSVDLVFVCDTYHHFEYPQRTLESIHRALKQDGRLVVVDFHRIPGVSREWTLGHVRAGQEVFAREITEMGFKKTGEEKLNLTENYFLHFMKVEPKGK